MRPLPILLHSGTCLRKDRYFQRPGSVHTGSEARSGTKTQKEPESWRSGVKVVVNCLRHTFHETGGRGNPFSAAAVYGDWLLTLYTWLNTIFQSWSGTCLLFFCCFMMVEPKQIPSQSLGYSISILYMRWQVKTLWAKFTGKFLFCQ